MVVSMRWLIALPLLLGACVCPAPEPHALFEEVRQLTFAGRRTGEAYFQGSKMIFQSEREPGNPFYQIYLTDLETGTTRRVSPGTGKTTCGWIHPWGRTVLFASTHLDPDAKKKQEAEIRLRETGKARRYQWDFDEHYDIFEAGTDGKVLRNLTDARGYDAEGSWSPEGDLIIFASNRHAYSEPMSIEEMKKFAGDPSYLVDLYLANADGSNARRLTRSPGYDGGPFFRPDGKRIVWRRFSPDGSSCEIFTMKTDGSDVKQVTRTGKISWAPFYSPDGEYIIFTDLTDQDMYMVDAEGLRPPVRVAEREGFDGLPVLHGDRLAWTSNATGDKTTQVFLAKWDFYEARRRLQLPICGPRPP